MQSRTDLELPRLFSWKSWLPFLLLALLWHAIILWLRPAWTPPLSPPRVEVKQVDPRKLEAIRQKWRQMEKNEPKQLLLNKDRSKPKEDVPPPDDARYMSDRNIRVKKEQRARDSQVIPRPGQQARPQQKQQQPRSRTMPPALNQLGVPMGLSQNKPQPTRKAQPAPDPDPPQNSTPGGDQSILDKNLPEGSENLLNAQESVYYSFYARIYESVGPIWESQIRQVPARRRVQQGEYSTTVDIVLDREGNLLEIRWIRTSGIPEFDAAVSNSWRRVGRFPNPPHGLLDARDQVHTGWTFTVQVGQGFNLQYLPPERNY